MHEKGSHDVRKVSVWIRQYFGVRPAERHRDIFVLGRLVLKFDSVKLCQLKSTKTLHHNMNTLIKLYITFDGVRHRKQSSIHDKLL